MVESAVPDANSSMFTATVSGDGLHGAVAGQTASFVIETFTCSGDRRRHGGEKFAVSLTGAATVRARVYDDGDGRYQCEYKCPSSGKYRLSIMNKSHHLPGSPFAVSVKSGGSLGEWTTTRVKEAAELKVRRKEKERERNTMKKGAPSPRIVRERRANASRASTRVHHGLPRLTPACPTLAEPSRAAGQGVRVGLGSRKAGHWQGSQGQELFLCSMPRSARGV